MNKFKLSSIVVSPILLLVLMMGNGICDWSIIDILFIGVVYALAIVLGWTLKREVYDRKINDKG